MQDTNLVVPTDQWINAYCEAPTLDGIALHGGDVIAAYAPGDLVGLMSFVQTVHLALCRFTVMTSIRLKSKVQTATRLHSRSADTPVFTDPVVVWTENGARIPVCNFLAELCRNLVLGEGWHLVSWNVPLMGDIVTMIFGDQVAVYRCHSVLRPRSSNI